MNNKIILVTHESIGTAFLNVLSTTFGQLPDCISNINVPATLSSAELIIRLQAKIETFPQEAEVLILTDLFGATPCNVVTNLQTKHQFRILTGLNMPMVLRAINYHHLPIDELTEKAYAGGKEGIIRCDQEHCPLPTN
jgi:PTS system mannose-specific IIA component